MTHRIDRRFTGPRIWPTLWLIFCCAFGTNALAAAKHGKQPHRTVRYKVLHITEGQQKVLRFFESVARVAVGDPEVADVSMTTPDELLVSGKKVGTTDLHVWPGDNKGTPRLYRVRVDPRLIEGEFQTLAEHAAKVQTEKPNARDATTVDVGGTQIQADIKVIEVSRTGLKEAGFFFGKNSANTTLAVSPPGPLSGVESAAAGSLLLQSASGFFPFLEAFNLVFGNSKQGWLSTISLLERSGYAYTLAEPSLTAMSGQTATFLAGGEFPIPVTQGGASSNAITITYREFGVRLMLTPTILDSDRIAMKVAPEVSELDFTAGVQSAGVRVPALKVRRTDTTIELGDGDSFAISGLISQTTIANEDKLPFLGDVPILGAFFRSKRFDKSDKELLMIVTPHIVHPLDRNAELPPLPGEAYRRTDPDYADFLFYKQDSYTRPRGAMEGFSR
ncbi:type II and III secretion system protein family protein [Methylocaldum sp. MU1018]|jgi:pilus assembly protein CpaC